MTTIRVEMSRLIARRLVRVLMLLTVGGLLVAATIVFFSSNHPDEFLEQQLQRVEQREQRCLEGEVRFPKGVNLEDPEALEDFCAHRGFFVEDPRFLYTEMTSILEGTSGLWFALALLIGATFIGAEWHSGNIATTLTWEPRRIRLYLAKAAALSIWVFIGSIVLQLLLSLFLAPAAILRGSAEGLDGEFWGDMASVGLRAAVLAVAIGLLGFGLASIGRNTGAALGIMFAYTAVIENVVRAWKPHWFGWLLTDNIVLVVSDEITYYGARRSLSAGILTVVAYVLIPLTIGLVMFKRRDVT